MKEPVKTHAPTPPATAPKAETKAPEPKLSPAEQRLRDFEDKHCGGKDAYRHEGKIERGHGSRFAALSDEMKAKHAALEKAVEAHLKVALAKDTLAAAELEAADAEAAANAQ